MGLAVGAGAEEPLQPGVCPQLPAGLWARAWKTRKPFVRVKNRVRKL